MAGSKTNKTKTKPSSSQQFLSNLSRVAVVDELFLISFHFPSRNIHSKTYIAAFLYPFLVAAAVVFLGDLLNFLKTSRTTLKIFSRGYLPQILQQVQQSPPTKQKKTKQKKYVILFLNLHSFSPSPFLTFVFQ